MCRTPISLTTEVVKNRSQTTFLLSGEPSQNVRQYLPGVSDRFYELKSFRV